MWEVIFKTDSSLREVLDKNHIALMIKTVRY